jgi:hypothetical protein
MRDLVVTENITLDGVIEATEGWFGPAGGKDDLSDVETALQEQREAADALFLGRITFEQMRVGALGRAPERRRHPSAEVRDRRGHRHHRQHPARP